MSNTYELFDFAVAAHESENKVKMLIGSPNADHLAATHLMYRTEEDEIAILDARYLGFARPLGIHSKEHAESLIAALSEAVEEGWFDRD